MHGSLRGRLKTGGNRESQQETRQEGRKGRLFKQFKALVHTPDHTPDCIEHFQTFLEYKY